MPISIVQKWIQARATRIDTLQWTGWTRSRTCPQICNDMPSLSTTFRRYVSVLLTENQVCVDHTNLPILNVVNFIESLTNENCQKDAFDDEVLSFPSATAFVDKYAFDWWKPNAKLYNTIAVIVNVHFVTIQSPSVSGGEAFSDSCNLVDVYHTVLGSSTSRFRQVSSSRSGISFTSLLSRLCQLRLLTSSKRLSWLTSE